MPANTNNKCLKQPEDGSTRLWRYMDFAKFVYLISSGKLFFCRSDLFNDSFEGSLPVSDVIPPRILTEGVFKGMMASDGFPGRSMRKWTHINCWHANEYESAAMWDLYAKSDGAVAIETTYDRLVGVLPSSVSLGFITYLDYKKDSLPSDNPFSRFSCKRKSFEHENEVRGLLTDPDFEWSECRSAEKHEEFYVKPGISVSIEVNNLITRIHVSPSAPGYLEDLVKEVAVKYGVKTDVKKSDLYSGAIF